jgi:hypothetical protein
VKFSLNNRIINISKPGNLGIMVHHWLVCRINLNCRWYWPVTSKSGCFLRWTHHSCISHRIFPLSFFYVIRFQSICNNLELPYCEVE